MARWLELLSRFDFTVSHRAGQNMEMQMLYPEDLALNAAKVTPCFKISLRWQRLYQVIGFRQ